MIKIITILVFAAILGCVIMRIARGEAAVSESKVEWLGWPVYATEYTGIDPGFYLGGAPPTRWVNKDIKIGLRADGVVVWREVDPND